LTRYPVRAGAKTAGFITSCVHSPRLKKNIGYAVVALEYSAPGTRLKVQAPDSTRSAVVVAMPFIDPKKALAKS
jgi:aminomethyltransferase